MSTTTSRRARRSAGALIASALSLSALAVISPAHADTGKWLAGGDTGATVSVADAVLEGDALHIEGTGWLDGTDDSDADGSWIAVKLGAGAGVEGGPLATEPADGQFTFPGTAVNVGGVWSGTIADDDCDFELDVPFPTADNTKPALADTWEVGEVHHLQLLAGTQKPGGDTVRSAYLTFTVDNGVIVNASNGGRGAPAAQVTLTASAAAGSFTPSTPVTATVDGTTTAFTAGGTSNAEGGLGNSTLVFAPGTLRAGDHEIVLTDGTNTYTETSRTLPVATFPSLAQGGEGTVTLANLPTGSSVASVAFGDATFSGLPAAADGSGTTSFEVAIPAAATLGTFPVVVTLADNTVFTLAGQKISPSTTTVGADKFAVTSTTGELFQGLYQSAYSAASNALFVSAGAGTNAAEAGAVYKLDPETLATEASLENADLPDSSSAGGKLAAYGIAVDDVHGTVWVTSTRKGSLYVLDQDDLSILKVFPEGTVSHGRDVIYDPTSDRIFVTSASEGTTGDGYISVFEADDENQNDTRFEEITKIQTGARSVYSPMSLELGRAGTLYSPSLTSDKVAVVDTENLTFSLLQLAGLSDVTGRGASGIAYDSVTNRLFVASQSVDELLIADATTGATVKEVPTGAGALNVAWDSVNRLAYVGNFGGSTISVVDANGNLVANLPITRANHVHEDGRGNVYAVDKATPNKVWKITPKPTTPPTTGNDQQQPPAATPLTPAQQKLANAQAKVAKAQAKVATVKAKIATVKKSALSKKAKAKQVKKLKKQLAKAKKAVTKQKKALAKVKKAVKKAAKKKK